MYNTAGLAKIKDMENFFIIIPVLCCLMLLGYLRHHQKQIDKEIKQVRDERLKAKKR